MGGACNTHGRGEMHTKFWSENLKRWDPLGRPRRRWEDIRMDLREIGWKMWSRVGFEIPIPVFERSEKLCADAVMANWKARTNCLHLQFITATHAWNVLWSIFPSGISDKRANILGNNPVRDKEDSMWLFWNRKPVNARLGASQGYVHRGYEELTLEGDDLRHYTVHIIIPLLRVLRCGRAWRRMPFHDWITSLICRANWFVCRMLGCLLA
jgi:hypothetical protein